MKAKSTASLAAEITRAASTQTYYTIRFLADRKLAPDAYRAYAYFRWLDDCLDAETGSLAEKCALVQREQSLLEACYRGENPGSTCSEEQMLVEMASHDAEKDSGLQSYLRNMMAVMAFDVERRGRLITQSELSAYSLQLATAVTDALHYFIGHDCLPPCSDARYLAVQGAHVVHMLRDLLEDTSTGYINIPREYLEAHRLSSRDLDAPAAREWVASRVKLANLYFAIGRDYIARVKNWRCRFAGFAYVARFEWMARIIERDGYRLRADYPERKSLRAAGWGAWRAVTSMLGWQRANAEARAGARQPVQSEE